MKTIYKRMDGEVAFILADLPPALQQAARDLNYELVPEGFARRYAADTPDLERFYHNFARYAEPMLLQAARLQAVPWQNALLALLERIEARYLNWWLVGSTALAVRGLNVTPRDIDLLTDDAGAHQLEEVLQDYLVEPLLPVHQWFCNWWGRAFKQVRIEWLGGVNQTADQPQPGDFGPEAQRRAETLTWRGYEVRVPPLDLQLVVSQRRGLVERVVKIQEALR